MDTVIFQNPNPLYNEKAAAEYLSCSVAKLQMCRHKRTGPKYVKMTRAVRYRRSDLDEYVENNLIDPTA